MPLDYSAVEEYHVRLKNIETFQPGRMWLGEHEEWQIEVQEGTARLSPEASSENGMSTYRLFGRLTKMVTEEQQLGLRTCGTCAYFRRSPLEERGEGWLGYCSYRGDEQNASPLPGKVSLLAPDCHLYQAATETPPVATSQELFSSNETLDPEETHNLPAVKTKKGFFANLLSFLGLKKQKQEIIRAGVIERPGGQPCPVCGTRMTNRASVANADQRGEERILSVWRCPHCFGNYLDDWFEGFVGSRAHDAERLYVVPPVEANKGAEIVVHCPRPDVKGCTCIANRHFDEWGNGLEGTGRRIKHRESVVSL